MATPKKLFGVLGLAVAVLLVVRAGPAQDVKVLSTGDDNVVITSEVSAGPSAAPAGVTKPDAAKPAGKPEKADAEKEKADQKKDEADKEKEADEKKEAEEAPKPILRPSTPPKPPDPEQLKAQLDEEGKIHFSFVGQAWPGVLEWFADVSDMSLDWQELPGDYLNLTTLRSYDLDEARDLINRHLLARGYTLLRHGEVFSVVNLEKLNPALVPRVEPEELDERDLHEFVKVCFTLDWLVAETAAEDLKPLLSAYGKLNPLKATNRLEVIDTVRNLREIRRLLGEEQSADGQKRLVEVFTLHYTRADEVLEQLRTLLGIDSKSKSAMPMMPDAIKKAQEAARKAAEEAAKKGVQPPTPAKPEPQINLVVNERQNSILAHAPPDSMAIIRQAIAAIDVPADVGHSLLAAMERMQIYRLAAIDPGPLVETLQKMGGLHPSTRLDVDEKNTAIIAFATAADHFTIGQIVEKLDGSGRSFRVITLRKHDAEMVAGTIQAMLTGETEKQPQNVRYLYNYGSSSRDRGGSEAGEDKFRVEPDVEGNRLLLRANELEYQEVLDLLVQLGEIPPEGGNPSKIRVLEGYWDEGTEEWIERVFRTWPSVAPNPLIPPTEKSEEQPPKTTPDEKSPRDEPAPQETETKTLPAAARGGDAEGFLSYAGVYGDRRGSAIRGAGTASPQVQFAQLKQAAADADATSPSRDATPSPSDATPPSEEAAPPPREDPPKSPAPIRISRDPDGRLVLTSEDTKALDLLEGLMDRLAPARDDHKIFQLKYAWAYGIALTLKEIFEEEEKESRPRYPYYYFYDSYDTGSKSDETRRMSKRRPLKFISDPDSNSILVQNADATQLKKIEELILFYDQPEPVDSQSVRKKQIFHLRYAKAAVIADAVKDVYRDLLSANDKALIAAQQGRQSPRESYTFVYDSGDGERQEQMAPRYKGSLSIGINELSNTLVVSARAYLLEEITEMIEELDEAARPTTESVYLLQVGNGLDASQIQKKLSSVLGGTPSGRQSSERSSRQRSESSRTSRTSPSRRSSR